MLIQSLKSHFRPRLPEWVMSGWLVTYGCYVVLHPDMFTSPATRGVFLGMSELAAPTGFHPASLWGLAAVIIGLVRASALFINGAFTQSPIVRLVTSIMSAAIVLIIVLGSIGNGVPNTGIPTYGWLFMLDMMSAYNAASDIPLAERNKQYSRGKQRVELSGQR